MKKQKSTRWVPALLAAAVAAQWQTAWAEYEELPTLVVEGEVMEPGTMALQPGTVGTLDAADLLRQVPGGNVNRNGPLTGIAQFRGLYGDRVNVITDGMSLKNAGINAMDSRMSHIPSALIESLKVYREVTPVSTGLETMGGSVITRTRRIEFGETEKFAPSAFLTAGYNWVSTGHYGGGVVGIANQNYRIFASGSREKGDNYRYKDNRNMIPTKYERSTWQAGFGMRRGGHEFNFAYDNKRTGESGTPALPMDIRWVDTDVYKGDYRWKLVNGWTLAFNGFFQNANHIMTNWELRQPPGNPAMWRTMKTDVNAGGYKFAFTIPQLGPGELEVGFDGDLATYNARIRNPNNPMFFVDFFDDVNRNRYGAYVEWRGEPVERLSLTAGVRYRYTYMDAGKVDGTPARMMPAARMLRDRFNASERRQDQHDVDVALNLRYAVNDYLDLALGLARKTHAPTYQQRYNWLPLEVSGGLADGRVYVGDVGLDSEKAYEVVAGFDLHLNRIGDWVHDLYFEPRGFYRYVNDYIQGQPETDPTVLMVANMTLPAGCPNNPSGVTAACVLRWSNIDAQLYGVDMRGGLSIGEHWRIDGMMSYTRGEKISGKNDNLYRIAPLNGRVRLTYSIWDLAFSGEYVGALRQDKVADYNNERKTSDWTVVNLRLQYQPSYKYLQGLRLAFGIDNVFDNRYADHLNGINRSAGVRGVPVGQRVPNPGRGYYATLSYAF